MSTQERYSEETPAEKLRRLYGLRPPNDFSVGEDPADKLRSLVGGLTPAQKLRALRVQRDPTVAFEDDPRTPTEEYSGRRFHEDDDSFVERVGRGVLSVGKEFARSLNVFGPGVSGRERAFRAANVASFFVPFGFMAKAASLGRVMPVLRPVIASKAGRVALTAAETGVITGGIEAIRDDDRQSVLAAGVLGAGLGAGVELVLGRVGRAARAARLGPLVDEFQDASRLLDSSASPLLNEQYAVLSAQVNGAPEAANVMRHAELLRQLDEAGFPAMPVKDASNGIDAVLVPGMTERQAIDVSLELGRPSVVTNNGFVNLRTGRMHPTVKSELHFMSGVPKDAKHRFVMNSSQGPVSFGFKFQSRGSELGKRVASKEARDLFELAGEQMIREEPIGLFTRLRTLDSRSLMERMYGKTVRGIRGLELFEKFSGTPAGKRIISSSPSKLVQMAKTDSFGFADSAITNKLRAFDDPTEIVDDGLFEIWKRVKPDEQELFDQYGYLRSIREIGERFGEEKLPKGFSLAEIEKALAEAPEHFDEVFNRTVEWRNRFTFEALVKPGVLTFKQFENLVQKRRNFIPHTSAEQRIAELGLAEAGQTGEELASFFTIWDPIDFLKSGKGRIFNWREELIKQSFAHARLGTQQRALRAIYNVIQEAPDPKYFSGFVRVVDKPPVKLTQQMRKLKEVVEGSNPELAEMIEDFGEASMNVISPELGVSNSLKANGFLRILDDSGKPIWMEVIDPLMWDAVQHMAPAEMNQFIRLASIPASMLRAGATTLAPGFIAKNPIRDAAFAYMTTGLNPFGVVRGFASLLRKDEFFHRWQAAGGPGSTLVNTDRQLIKAELRKRGSVPNVVKNPLIALQTLSQFSENGTRLGIFRRELAKLMPRVDVGEIRVADAIREAALVSKSGTVDFSMNGSSPVVAGLKQLVSFWNANIQGTDVFVKALMQRPKETLPRVLASITLPSLFFYLKNRNDPEYRQLPDYERDLFWHVKALPGMPVVGDQWLRFPKPFEPGILFGSSFERFLEAMDDEDPSVLDRLGADVSVDFMNSFIPVPTFADPFWNIAVNKSRFTGRPIEPRSLRDNVDNAFRTTQGTSEVAKIFSQRLGLSRIGLSPLEVDEIFRGYTGTAGREALSIADYAIEAADAAFFGGKAIPPQPAKGAADIPFLGAFVSRFPLGAQPVEDFYRLADDARIAAGTANFLEKTLQTEDYVDWVVAKAKVSAIEPMMRKTTDRISQIRRQKSLILEAPEMDSGDKRMLLEKLDREILWLTASVVEGLKGVGIR
jgi:hypothetical protein